MGDQSSNDNGATAVPVRPAEPDPHGQAAMLLTESLLHGLIARSVITVPDALEIVEVALEVKEDIAADLGDSQATMRRSLALLSAIRSSLLIDHEPDAEREDRDPAPG